MICRLFRSIDLAKRLKRMHGSIYFSQISQFSDKQRNKLILSIHWYTFGENTIKANMHSFIIMFHPALVLYEQSNCIDRIHICYMRSLTKILFLCYLICDDRRKKQDFLDLWDVFMLTGNLRTLLCLTKRWQIQIKSFSMVFCPRLYFYLFLPSVVTNQVAEKQYFGQWPHITNMYPVNAIWLLI
jgi:hypothetical protein